MDITTALNLLGGLSAGQFMRRHWHKKPLLVRQALRGSTWDLRRADLFGLAARDDVESRLVTRPLQGGWCLRHGPLSRRALPPLSRPGWTLLVQGLDLHMPAAHELLQRFRFVPDARLDDVMVSYASDGGGVGPHLDAYDVFLIQLQGRRRWQIGRVADDRLVDGLPLKILQDFKPEQEWVLEPGDMLYLPPRWGHDGVAVGGDCMTCSVGFRSPSRAELAGQLMARLADTEDQAWAAWCKQRYRDPAQPATSSPGQVPQDLLQFAREAVQRATAQPGALETVLGEWLTEPKPQVWFEPGPDLAGSEGIKLDPRTRMMYDAQRVFINGESFRAGGRDARLMRELADQRVLSHSQVVALSPQARALLGEWAQAGWLRAQVRRDERGEW